MHGHPLSAYAPVLEQTALFCGMRWEEPIVLHAAHRVSDTVLDEAAASYRARLRDLIAHAEAPS